MCEFILAKRYCINTHSVFINSKLKDKKAAKLIIKRAKKDPKLYTKEEVRFAKMVRKRIKEDKKNNGNCEQV